MYSEELNKMHFNSIRIVEYVLDNLCKDTKTELKMIFGDDYIRRTFEQLRNTEIFVIRLKSNNEPVGLFGLIELSKNSAGIYFLTTDKLHNGNIITLLKGTKKQINEWAKIYKLIMDNCSKHNKTIQKWLTLLGFKPSEYEDENFQIYYLGDITLYE